MQFITWLAKNIEEICTFRKLCYERENTKLAINSASWIRFSVVLAATDFSRLNRRFLQGRHLIWPETHWKRLKYSLDIEMMSKVSAKTATTGSTANNSLLYCCFHCREFTRHSDQLTWTFLYIVYYLGRWSSAHIYVINWNAFWIFFPVQVCAETLEEIVHQSVRQVN